MAQREFDAAITMAVDAAAADVVTAFQESGVRCILLKGRTLGQWLYGESELRTYVDVDLLVDPQDFTRAEEVLAEFELERFPVAGVDHADTWMLDPRRIPVELHRSLVGVGASPEHVWRLLSSDTELMDVGGVTVEALGIPARAMHVAIHAAQHGSGVRKFLDDLSRALAQGEETWRAAQALAQELDAVEAFSAGLRLLPEGRRLAMELSLPRRTSAQTVLLTHSPPPLAMGVARVASASGVRAKARLLIRKVFPEPAFMRVWSTLARRGRLGLAAAYLLRPLWIVWRSGPALRAWFTARKEARSSSRSEDLAD
jgi:hypothetical protein